MDVYVYVYVYDVCVYIYMFLLETDLKVRGIYVYIYIYIYIYVLETDLKVRGFETIPIAIANFISPRCREFFRGWCQPSNDAKSSLANRSELVAWCVVW